VRKRKVNSYKKVIKVRKQVKKSKEQKEKVVVCGNGLWVG